MEKGYILQNVTFSFTSIKLYFNLGICVQDCMLDCLNTFHFIVYKYHYQGICKSEQGKLEF